MNNGIDLRQQPRWRKSSYSGSEGGECVEVADVGGQVAVRDSKSPGGPELAFPAAAFEGFVTAVAADGLGAR